MMDAMTNPELPAQLMGDLRITVFDGVDNETMQAMVGIVVRPEDPASAFVIPLTPTIAEQIGDQLKESARLARARGLANDDDPE